ncbi:MAG: ATP-binding protein, partial [Methanosarcinales archaeon]|nr:ATP-binding protein [Methanosarcinales archaeon]
MNRFENTKLWQITLAIQSEPDPEHQQRMRLRETFYSFRERAKMLAGEISRDLPDFTVHDISHIDALWEMAQLVAGQDFVLTPPEAFVLGGAFLIHDLGMGVAAYPNGIEELRKGQLWNDTIFAETKNNLKRAPTDDEIKNPNKEIERSATQSVLRDSHAKHAEKLALIKWKESVNNAVEYHLIEDTELRQTYGRVIGLIAHSHWWPIEKLIDNLPAKLGAPGGFSNEWTVDPVKLACLLRISDACHIDERRAPGFLRAIRKPDNEASKHWVFQENLYQPLLESDRLVYTSKNAFTTEENSSWWYCYDTLQMIDHELRNVDSLLTDKNRQRLAARGVSNVEEPKRLVKSIPTEGWEPVDTQVKVSAVATLINNLGGEQLYGKNELVPLRELIQNATDAIRARHLMEKRLSNWGDIFVRQGRDGRGYWIEVEDTGIGMSPEVLAGPFLDFGTSFWGSGMMHKELPGLESKRFVSTGKYGIGFFSVFMWGNDVQIITRRYDKAHKDTWKLEFTMGLSSRPLLRKAETSEVSINGGTRVRVYLKDQPNFLQYDINEKWSLEDDCSWLCPSIDANLFLEDENGSNKKIISASDWMTIDGITLLKRVIRLKNIDNHSLTQEYLNILKNHLQLLKNSSGEIVGRACIFNSNSHGKYLYNYGIVTVGGFRASELSGIVGILLGEPYRASRDIAIPIIEQNILGEWATKQAGLIVTVLSDSERLSNIASVIKCLGGYTGDLPIALSSKGWVSSKDISECKNTPEEVIIVQDASLSLAQKEKGKIILNDNVYAVNVGKPGIFQGSRSSFIDWPEFEIGHNDEYWQFYIYTLVSSQQYNVVKYISYVPH